MRPLRALPALPPRWSLWAWLVGLVALTLGTLIWLAGRYEVSRLQQQLDDDAAQVVADLRATLTRNLQGLQALQFNHPEPEVWARGASEVLRERRELLRIEWRDPALALRQAADSPYTPAPMPLVAGGEPRRVEIEAACAGARRFGSPAYNSSYFVPRGDGVGSEVMDLCMPLVEQGRPAGYLVAVYSLQGLLAALPSTEALRARRVAFHEGDGSRLAVWGRTAGDGVPYSGEQLLGLPGTALVLRLDAWRGVPALFPNVLTAVVGTLSVALLLVLALLGRDMRRRQSAERALAEALAFRKAMEDSLVTGLRARDLAGRISYVNPAFCAMVGFEAAELLGQQAPAPYWPTERIAEYQERNAIRLSGQAPPREGFESVFMRKDGSRFPVLIIEAPLIDARGVQTGWMSACVDISAQKEAEAMARNARERLRATARLATVGEMASLLSHELNQPLAAISSYASGSLNLLEGPSAPRLPPGGPPRETFLAQALQRIAEQAERAGRIIRSVHDFVRRSEPVREAASPHALIEAVMPLVSLQARRLGVHVVIDADPMLPPVLCDHTLVEQVLLNLSRNGMQAMDALPPGAPRELRLGVGPVDADGRLQFAVADLGGGIGDEVASQLYTPFFTTKPDGMGLGLSLCRSVVEQHGGQLLHCRNVPQGTIFRFTLQVAPVAAPDRIPHATAPSRAGLPG